MQSLQDKMETDVLWVRPNPALAEAPKARTHGYHYLYTNVPNVRERIEMIYRSMGRQHDWEMEKFRLGKKPIDKGNKKRLIRNFCRFIKHPFGYQYWKTFNFFAIKPRFVLVGFSLFALHHFMQLKMESRIAANKIKFLVRIGKDVEGIPGQGHGVRQQKMFFSNTLLSGLLKYPIRAQMVVINPVWKQGFRKQFSLLNAHKVRI